ncbi:MAG: hypothetical protein HY929_06235 [Euryarchaeota archaeon]|nr:hypothetical protein [Euryarchaeota archaeon]
MYERFEKLFNKVIELASKEYPKDKTKFILTPLDTETWNKTITLEKIPTETLAFINLNPCKKEDKEEHFHIYFNPEKLLPYSDTEILYLFLHEIIHGIEHNKIFLGIAERETYPMQLIESIVTLRARQILERNKIFLQEKQIQMLASKLAKSIS